MKVCMFTALFLVFLVAAPLSDIAAQDSNGFNYIEIVTGKVDNHFTTEIECHFGEDCHMLKSDETTEKLENCAITKEYKYELSPRYGGRNGSQEGWVKWSYDLGEGRGREWNSRGYSGDIYSPPSIETGTAPIGWYGQREYKYEWSGVKQTEVKKWDQRAFLNVGGSANIEYRVLITVILNHQLRGSNVWSRFPCARARIMNQRLIDWGNGFCGLDTSLPGMSSNDITPTVRLSDGELLQYRVNAHEWSEKLKFNTETTGTLCSSLGQNTSWLSANPSPTGTPPAF